MVHLNKIGGRLFAFYKTNTVLPLAQSLHVINVPTSIKRTPAGAGSGHAYIIATPQLCFWNKRLNLRHVYAVHGLKQST